MNGYMQPDLRLPGVRPLTRSEKLDKARTLIREAGIREDRELFDLVNNLVASIDGHFASPDMHMCKAQLTDSACWLEGPRDELQPEILGHDKRGEYDIHTVGVRHRG